MRFQRRQDLTGKAAQKFMQGISRISGLAEVGEDQTARIWLRGEPHSVEAFLARVYGLAKVEEAGGDAGENGGDGGQNGGEGGEEGGDGGEEGGEGGQSI